MRPVVRLVVVLFLGIGLVVGLSSTSAAVDTLSSPLSDEMIALRARVVRAVLAWHARPLNTRDHTPHDAIHACLAFGREAKVSLGGATGKKVNAIGTLCWNYPLAGQKLLLLDDESRWMARVGYAQQSLPSQFLAVLAQARVSSTYELREGDARGTIRDLIDFEKSSCQTGSNSPSKLIALSGYLDDDETWENELGETWSLDRLVEEELGRTTERGQPEVIEHLLALSHAVASRRRHEKPIDGVYLRAESLVGKHHDYALDLQNVDGTWHPRFFALKGAHRDPFESLHATGRILGWLAFSLPEERLDEPRMVKSVQYVSTLLAGRGMSWSVQSMTPRQLASVMHSLNALSVYNDRYFVPRLPKKKVENAQARSVIAPRRF